MYIGRGIPTTPRQQAIETAMTRLECYEDIANTDKALISEYVEELEDELGKCIMAANQQGWNGVDNSKILSVFLGSLVADTAERCAKICEGEVLLPISEWQGTKRRLTAAMGEKLAAMIRHEFNIGYVSEGPPHHGSRCGGCEICGSTED